MAPASAAGAEREPRLQERLHAERPLHFPRLRCRATVQGAGHDLPGSHDPARSVSTGPAEAKKARCSRQPTARRVDRTVHCLPLLRSVAPHQRGDPRLVRLTVELGQEIVRTQLVEIAPPSASPVVPDSVAARHTPGNVASPAHPPPCSRHSSRRHRTSSPAQTIRRLEPSGEAAPASAGSHRCRPWCTSRTGTLWARRRPGGTGPLSGGRAGGVWKPPRTAPALERSGMWWCHDSVCSSGLGPRNRSLWSG